MKIIFISGVKFGYDILSHLIENNWKISAVFSYSEDVRKNYSDSISFKSITQKNKIEYFEVNNINDEENIQIIKKFYPDLILVMGWSQILKDVMLKIPSIGIIGSHPTELPKYRGRSPIPWTIIKNLKESALTFFWIEHGVDNGDILYQEKFSISDSDDAQSIYEKITIIGKNMIIKSLLDISQGKLVHLKQNNSKFLEYWEKRTPDDGKIDWEKSSNEIHTLIRAVTYPYPGAFTDYLGQKLIVWKSDNIENNLNEPGKILQIEKDGVLIGTGKNSILIREISYAQYDKVNPQQIFTNNDVGMILGK